MNAPICEEHQLHWYSPQVYWYEPFPCGRWAVVWHNGRLMCRSCRRHALRCEARIRRATEGGVLGTLVNAAPTILIVSGYIIFFALFRKELELDEKIANVIKLHGREYCEVAFLVLLWLIFKAVDARLVRAWSRRGTGENGERHRDARDRRESWE